MKNENDTCNVQAGRHTTYIRFRAKAGSDILGFLSAFFSLVMYLCSPVFFVSGLHPFFPLLIDQSGDNGDLASERLHEDARGSRGIFSRVPCQPTQNIIQIGHCWHCSE